MSRPEPGASSASASFSRNNSAYCCFHNIGLISLSVFCNKVGDRSFLPDKWSLAHASEDLEHMEKVRTHWQIGLVLVR